MLEEIVFSDIQAHAEEVCIREKKVIRQITEQKQVQLKGLWEKLGEYRKTQEDVQEWAALMRQCISDNKCV